MSVAGILNSLSSLQLGRPGAAKQGIQQLKKDLQTGNLSAAQSDFAALQRAFSQSGATAAANSSATNASNATPSSNATSLSHPPSPHNPIRFSQAVNQLTSAITSNNLPAAQRNLSSLQEARRHGDGTDSAASIRHQADISGTTATSLFSQLTQALVSGNLASAQQAYASLQSQQLSALRTGEFPAESPVSMLA